LGGPRAAVAAAAVRAMGGADASVGLGAVASVLSPAWFQMMIVLMIVLMIRMQMGIGT